MLRRDALKVPKPFSTEPCATHPVSSWTRSRAKRIFDVAVVLALVPLLLPMLAAIALAVVLSCGRPVFFRQRRAGGFGRTFVIWKFRTMNQVVPGRSFSIATHAADEVTMLGRFLRRWKLDELPQAWNVLVGDMSMVGPRPKIPAQQLFPLGCRPGVTGPATLAFACEERLLAEIPRERLDAYYRDIVLPAKHRLDSKYMARATVFSDLRIVLLTALGRWQGPALAHGATAAFSNAQSSPYQNCNPGEPGQAIKNQNFPELSQVCHSIVADGF